MDSYIANESRTTIDLEQNITSNDNNPYRKELVMAKVVISEYQEKYQREKDEREKLERELNEALENIKSLHKDYCALTDRINQTRKVDDEVQNLKEIINMKEEEMKRKEDAYKVKIMQLNEQISLLMQKVNAFEKKISSEEEKCNEENKNLKISIEKLKCNISLLQSENIKLKDEVKVKENDLLKQRVIVDKFSKLNNTLSLSLKEKDKIYSSLNEKFNILFKENKTEHAKNVKLGKQKKYLENILIRHHPNSELIRQIIELNEDIIILEEQREKLNSKLDDNNNGRAKERANKLFYQIDMLKEQVEKMESRLYTESNSSRLDTSLFAISKSS